MMESFYLSAIIFSILYLFVVCFNPQKKLWEKQKQKNPQNDITKMVEAPGPPASMETLI